MLFLSLYQGGPHPGLRAAAEMKKQAAAQQGANGKGIMGVVLPMYAIGIVIYLIYTMTKVSEHLHIPSPRFIIIIHS